jgi:hypothetical protein
MNTHVKEAGFGKRLLAYLIDAACVIIMTAIFYTFVTSTYLYGALGGKKDLNEMNSFAVDSSLLSASYDTNSSITSISAYVLHRHQRHLGRPERANQGGLCRVFR